MEHNTENNKKNKSKCFEEGNITLVYYSDVRMFSDYEIIQNLRL